MKKEWSFLMPSPYLSFITGLLGGAMFFGLVYAGCEKEWWPLEFMVGKAVTSRTGDTAKAEEIAMAGESGAFGKSLYLLLYVFCCWGLALIYFKSKLSRYEYRTLLNLKQNFPSSRVISERKELESLKAMVSHGPEGIRIRNSAVGQILLFLIDHCLVVGSSERIVEIFTRRMDTLQKHAEASYDMLRYIAWAIPSIGFIGTVLGISQALSQAKLALDDIGWVTQPLGLAFDTTLIALFESLVLMFFIYNRQHKEEKLLNDIDIFCQEKFIINLRMQQDDLAK